MTPLVRGLAGLGLDLANPNPFSLSCKRVAPWAGAVVDRDREAARALAI